MDKENFNKKEKHVNNLKTPVNRIINEVKKLDTSSSSNNASPVLNHTQPRVRNSQKLTTINGFTKTNNLLINRKSKLSYSLNSLPSSCSTPNIVIDKELELLNTLYRSGALDNTQKPVQTNDNNNSIIAENTPVLNNTVNLISNDINDQYSNLNRNLNFEDEDERNTNIHDNFLVSGFQTAGGKNIIIKKDSFSLASERLKENEATNVPNSNSSNLIFSSFQTAGGKTIQISTDAINKASEKLKENTKETYEFGHSAEEPNNVIVSGFQTAGGKNIKINKESISLANEKLKSDDFTVPSIVDNSYSNVIMSGFQTASGKSIQVSREAINLAQDKLTENSLAEQINNVTSSNLQTGMCFTVSGFQTAVGNSLSFKAESLETVRGKLDVVNGINTGVIMNKMNPLNLNKKFIIFY